MMSAAGVLFNSFALVRTFECFCNPHGVLTICVGKSTYAHCEITIERDAIRAGVGNLQPSKSSPALHRWLRFIPT